MQPLFDIRGQIGKLRKRAKDLSRRLCSNRAYSVRGGDRPQSAVRARVCLCLAEMDAVPHRGAGGLSVASLDWSGQEIAIAAALSGDGNLLLVYKSGDAHLKAGKLFGIIPEEGTAEIYAAERDMVKPVMFGSNYGAGAIKLAQLAKISVSKARELRALHHRTFPRFWKWITQVQQKAYRDGKIEMKGFSKKERCRDQERIDQWVRTI